VTLPASRGGRQGRIVHWGDIESSVLVDNQHHLGNARIRNTNLRAIGNEQPFDYAEPDDDDPRRKWFKDYQRSRVRQHGEEDSLDREKILHQLARYGADTSALDDCPDDALREFLLTLQGML
jgi:hypothetical protein